LDGNPDESRQWARELAGEARWVKVGMTLFYLTGPAIIDEMQALGYKVFLDLKLHDIPHQVEGAANRLGRLGVDLLTVHALGGRAMMAAALHGANQGAKAAGKVPPKVIAVTVLTSMNDASLQDVGVPDTVEQEVQLLMRLSAQSCLDGIVCSPREAAEARSSLGMGALIVTPGVRPAGAATGDQSRVMTPREALWAGASHLVIGRPITEAKDRVKAYNDILHSLTV